MDYGTGAIFGCPLMIKEILILQKNIILEIIKVVADEKDRNLKEAYTGNGKL